MSKSEDIKSIILNAIDTLRQRKARPDLQHIFQFLERRHGFTEVQVKNYLDALLETETIIKVDYKGNISYRNMEKWPGRFNYRLKHEETNTVELSNVLTNATRAAMEANHRKSGTAMVEGAPFSSIEQILFSQRLSGKFNSRTLRLALDREVTSGKKLCRLQNGNFFPLTDAKEVQESNNFKLQSQSDYNDDENQSNSASEYSSSNLGSDVDICISPEKPKLTLVRDPKEKPKAEGFCRISDCPRVPKWMTPQLKARPLSSTGNNANIGDISPSKRRIRAPSLRKRFKKFHGPDFLETSSLPSLDCIDDIHIEEEIKCDYCLMPASSNPSGIREELLICKDCNAKAHPSCMEYSPELALKSHQYAWQCMDCKICTVCEDAEDGECMLFCDSCDKGYHMSCHKPKIVEKPVGKWVCYQCVDDPTQETSSENSEERSENMVACRSKAIDQDKVEEPVPTDLPGLPTPSDSPASDMESNDSDNKAMASPESKENDVVVLDNTNKLDAYPQIIPDAKDWTTEDVEKFLLHIGFTEQATVFREQEIDGKSLLLMKRSDVLTGLSLRLGPALKIYNHIKRLQSGSGDGKIPLDN